jgi:phosphoglycolate phosphatase-like HAD superfamily hydrolase
MKRCYLFDIDGTIADLSHRLHHIQKEPKDWRAFFAACADDEPIPHVIELAKRLWATVPIIFVSGRSDECRDETMAWLETHGFGSVGKRHERFLYMRRAGDHRPDNLVKAELLDAILADGFEPIMAFDDRDQVVRMWRGRGIPCAQVAAGDF